MPQPRWWTFCAFTLACLSTLEGLKVHRSQPIIFNEHCALNEDPGWCKAMYMRYFYNINTRRCEMFNYGGCGGNSNNFLTLEECESACIVTDDKNPCHLEAAAGQCKALVLRFYFDSKIQRCTSFYYGGCFGNANNFMSLADCQARCGNPEILAEEENESADQESDDACSSPVDSGTCDGSIRRFAYNSETKKCRAFQYTGCGGNQNNFQDRKQCIQKCKRRTGKRLVMNMKKRF